MKTAFRIILILALLAGWYYAYNNMGSPVDKIAKDIEVATNTIATKQSIIDEALQAKVKAEKIKKASEDYIRAIQEADVVEVKEEPAKEVEKHKTNTACMDWTSLVIEEWYWENFTKIDNCWMFGDLGIEWCYKSVDWKFCLLNDDLTELNRLITKS